MDFRPVSTEERQKLVDALRGNAEDNLAILMDRKDTSFLGTTEEVSEDEVIAAIQSVPCHYAVAEAESDYPASLAAIKQTIKHFIKKNERSPSKIFVPQEFEAKLLRYLKTSRRPVIVLNMEPIWDAEHYYLE